MSVGTIASRLVVGFVVVCAGFLPGCNQAQRRERAVHFRPVVQSQFTQAQQAQIDRHCGPFGMPAKDWSVGATHYVTRDTYVLEHHPVDKIPMWVAQHVTAGQWNGAARRPSASSWKAEDGLSVGQRAELSDYKYSGYQRGHMAPNGDYGPYEDRLSTFVLSNAVPQNGPQNEDLWASLEGAVRGLISQRGEGYIVTGGLFYEEEEENGAGDGTVTYYVVGSNQVAVPTHTFKVVLVPEAAGSDTWEAYAFVAPNVPPPQGWRFADYKKSVDWVEARSGLNFFPMLTGADESRIEGTVRTPPF